DMTWAREDGRRERTLLVLAGGELLLDGVRETLFYPVLDAIRTRWGERGPKLAIQTTGDVLAPDLLDEVLSRGVASIAIASIDDYHVGMEGDRRLPFMEKIRALMASRGVREVEMIAPKDERLRAPDVTRSARAEGPTFLFFGAQPDLWIGELWPRGRAFANGLSNAGYETNFCARWSGAKNFLKFGRAGSEIAIEPDGSVYPCCLKTKAPLGSLAEERLEDILESVAALPAVRALNDGDPEAMGLADGWSREDFRARANTVDGKGRHVENMCFGCDRFFEEKLGADLARLREARLSARAAL
ncbi:MAG: SPASM domain-containing protein, partial [Parvularculaceae bacterium]|nr:SPASM domain-containing protein [Parvularculaceae bacterium]